MEYERCSVCNKEIYGSINGIAFCVKHYVENYRKDKRFLEAKLNQLLDYVSRGEELTDKEKELLREIKIQYPETAEEFSILFDSD